VIPVVWRNRLFLFWLKILGETPIDPNSPNLQPSPSPSDDELAKVHLNTVKTDAANEAKRKAQVTIRAILCWSEYYNGKWQPTKTSDINRPTVLGYFDPAGDNAFDRSALRLHTSLRENALRVWIVGQGGAAFLLYNTHSAPIRDEDFPVELGEAVSLGAFSPARSLDTSGDTFTAHYNNRGIDLGSSNDFVRPILKNKLNDSTIAPWQPPLDNAWGAPFLYEDSKNVFYVTTTDQLVTVRDFAGLGPSEPSAYIVAIPPIVPQRPRIAPPIVPPRPPIDKIIDPAGPVIGAPDVGVGYRSAVERFLSEDANILTAIASGATVRFGGRDFGPTGAQAEVGNE
jgi:hypothetical protein